MKYICNTCSEAAEVSTTEQNCRCGGLWNLDFTPPAFSLDLIDKSDWTIFRYKAFLPLSGDNQPITLGEGLSPIVSFDDKLMLKMDYFMPTLSFKDRGAAVLISHCNSIGVESVVQDSSGNAGNSVAAYSAKAGVECEIFVPEGTSPKKINMIEAHGAKVNVVPGSRDNCADVCRNKAKSERMYYANHVYNPFFYQGTKTYIYEIYEQLGRLPKNIFIPVGNGTLFLGTIIALEEFVKAEIITEMPNIIVVQSEKCAPLFTAFEQNADVPASITPEPTYAEGIAIGVPMRGKEILAYVKKYGFEVITAKEQDILPARAELAKKGIYCEHTTAATYAAYVEYMKKHPETTDSIIPMCGAGLKSDK